MPLLQIITQTTSDIFSDVLTGLAILIGGCWTFWRFVLQREGNAKIQFDVDLQVTGIHRSSYIVEIIATVENKGLVRHYVNDFSFKILHLTEQHDIKDGGENINNQLLFEKIIDKRYWIPPKWVDSFIDAGVVQHYTYVTHLPAHTKFALVYAKFKYPDKKSEFHTAQRVFKLPINNNK